MIENQMTNRSGKDSMIRGSLPMAWVALIGFTIMLYIIPVNDPTLGEMGEMIVTLQKGYFSLFMAILLTLLTYFLGLPSVREAVAATVTGIAACVALIALAAVADFVWLIIGLWFFIVPLSGFFFHQLMRCNVANEVSHKRGRDE